MDLVISIALTILILEVYWKQNSCIKIPHRKWGFLQQRSPLHPNPISLSAVKIFDIDYMNGMIHITYIDANDKTPILDIKSYMPSLDMVENLD